MSIKSVIYLTYILRKAKEKRAELAVFDFAYAYGSIPHKLVDLADIGGHHIPLTIRAMLKAQDEIYNWIFHNRMAEIRNVNLDEVYVVSVVPFATATNL